MKINLSKKKKITTNLIIWSLLSNNKGILHGEVHASLEKKAYKVKGKYKQFKYNIGLSNFERRPMHHLVTKTFSS